MNQIENRISKLNDKIERLDHTNKEYKKNRNKENNMEEISGTMKRSNVWTRDIDEGQNSRKIVQRKSLTRS